MNFEGATLFVANNQDKDSLMSFALTSPMLLPLKLIFVLVSYILNFTDLIRSYK
jgi:hypothetical protein